MDPKKDQQNNVQDNPRIIQPQSPNVTGPAPEQPPEQQPAEPARQADNQAAQPDSAQPVSSSTTPPPVQASSTESGSQPPANGKKKKTLAIALTSAAAILVLFLGLVFGYYLPNRPENVWSRGLDRTGTALTGIVENVTEEEKLKEFSSSEVTASVAYEGEEGEFKGELDAKVDGKNAEGSFFLDLQPVDSDGPDGIFNLDFIVEVPEAKTLPDLFFRFSGTETFGPDMILPGIEEIENQWILVSSDFLEEELSPRAVERAAENEGYISSGEATQLARTITETTSEYVFTSDEDKAVLENREFVGAEDIDDLRTYRYKVGVNSNNAQRYCEVLAERVIDTPAYKKLTGSSDELLQQDKEDAKEDCARSTENIDEDEVFDMWIDRRTKLIYKVRFVEEDGTIVEAGQKYNGDDRVTLFVNTKSESTSSGFGEGVAAPPTKHDFRTEITVDLNASSVEGSMTLNHESGFRGESVTKMTFSIKPYDGELVIETPDEFMTIEELGEWFEETYGSRGAGLDDNDEFDDDMFVNPPPGNRSDFDFGNDTVFEDY